MRKMGIRWMRPHGHQIMKVMVATKMVAMQQLHAKNKTVIKIEPGISPRFLDHGASSYRRASQHDGEGDTHLRGCGLEGGATSLQAANRCAYA